MASRKNRRSIFHGTPLKPVKPVEIPTPISKDETIFQTTTTDQIHDEYICVARVKINMIARLFGNALCPPHAIELFRSANPPEHLTPSFFDRTMSWERNIEAFQFLPAPGVPAPQQASEKIYIPWTKYYAREIKLFEFGWERERATVLIPHVDVKTKTVQEARYFQGCMTAAKRAIKGGMNIHLATTVPEHSLIIAARHLMSRDMFRQHFKICPGAQRIWFLSQSGSRRAVKRGILAFGVDGEEHAEKQGHEAAGAGTNHWQVGSKRRRH